MDAQIRATRGRDEIVCSAGAPPRVAAPRPAKKNEKIKMCQINVTDGRTDRRTDANLIPAWTQLIVKEQSRLE